MSKGNELSELQVSAIPLTQYGKIRFFEKMTRGKKPRVSLAFKYGTDKNIEIARRIVSEHSPIRGFQFLVGVHNVPYYVAMHLRTHDKGFKPTDDETICVSSSRADYTGIDRSERRQTDLVDFGFEINLQSLVNASRVRLCSRASLSTRIVWNTIVEECSKSLPCLLHLCVPNCTYRGFCPEKAIGMYCGRTDIHTNVKQYREYIDSVSL